MQVQKTGKTIGGSSKIKVFDILEKIGFGDGFGFCFGVILAPSWRQVGSKGGFGGFENESKKNMKKRSRGAKWNRVMGGGSPLIEQYKQPDCRQLTTNARLADSRHFRP